MKFKEQVAYICVDCKKGFRREQLTPVQCQLGLKAKFLFRFAKNNKKLMCDSCIENQAKSMVEVLINKELYEIPKVANLTQAYKFLLGVR